ncbi:hypothetical protein FNV43_RR01154 [Rhamnella rubrinervis]|uniref:NADP-dependent oxidoreductase domain-containing protein n=1 Tax=Rhamnella rubrinervis TaxID=2594499 RepID=A0A8K0MS14_9ROSA|nr:hypothetical protein FNV43_RR01154 [Rhamnella rubrinervis]
MASSTTLTTIPASLYNTTRGRSHREFTCRSLPSNAGIRSYPNATIRAKLGEKNTLQYRKLGDSDLEISEITLGTMTFGEQNTEKEAHELLSYSFDKGINAIDTAEAYPIPMKKETQGKTDLYIGSWLKSQPRDKVILATKVCGYSERSSYIRDNAKILELMLLIFERVPDRYVALFGEFYYDPSKWRPSVPFVEQLRAFKELIDEGKVRYIGVSNETSYGLKFATPKTVTLDYCLIRPRRSTVRKYLDANSEAAKRKIEALSWLHG